MSRAGQRSQSRAKQFRAGRAGAFGGGGGGGGEIPPAEGCKLFYAIEYPYRIDENNPVVRTPAFWWNDGPSSRVVPDEWFHYGEGEFFGVRLENPIQSQVFDTFNKNMDFFGASRDDTKVFSTIIGEGIDDFGPWYAGFGEGYVDALYGGRGGYIGWKRVTHAVLRNYVVEGFYSLLTFDRLGDVYRSHPVEMSMASGPVNVGRHQWWQDPIWEPKGGDPWRAHWRRVLTVRANGVWPGPGRGSMAAQKWRDHQGGDFPYPEFREQGTGVGVAGPNASFQSDSFITDQQDDSRLAYPGPGWDWGRYLIDQRSGQQLTDREFVTIRDDGTEGFRFYGWDWSRRTNDWDSVLVSQAPWPRVIENHPIWGLIREDGFEDVVPFTGGLMGASHGYETQVVTYKKPGSWRDMRRILVVQFAFDQYGVLGYGEMQVVPVQYNYSSVGWRPEATLPFEFGGLAGK